ncbi:MAG: TlyA family RNA methyltransferase [Epsilonproteobacteria bacterium]|nr:TlyA family RNA methyltransferase [Campylobacterota bacterium]
MSKLSRLDEEMLKRGLAQSRNKAKELILSSKVTLNGTKVTKPSVKVSENDKIEVISKSYVSRAAYKLKNYLQKHNITFKNKSVLDVGSSTGGFSEVSLESGANKVVSVDVGSNQMHPSLIKRVELFENTDIRDFEYPEAFDVVVSDVSFISLLKIMDKIDSLAKDEIILLFKPQFEVGREVKRNKKGVVLDKKAVDSARRNFENYAKKLGWNLIRSEESSLKGKEGNVEFIYHFKKV